MIKMYTARTAEVDDFDVAIADIKAQIDFSALKKYSGGIILSCMDFFESGMVEALCKILPFDVIGMTSMANACNKGHGFYDLSLTVLTSDEVKFSAGMVSDINASNHGEKISTLYNDIRKKTEDDPSLIITFFPYLKELAACSMVASADKAVKGVPVWGSLASSINFTTDDVGVMCNGTLKKDGLAMLFINGLIQPRFILANLPEYNISSVRGIVTKSDGANLIEVNDIPVLEYFKQLGIELVAENIRATPLIVYEKNNTQPKALAFYTLEEDGSVMMGGEVPVGASITVGGIDSGTIIDSCKEGLAELLECEGRAAAFIIPCVSRGVMLVPDQEGEIRLVYETLKDFDLPFVMGYAGGEISPMYDINGNIKNHFHNYTFCACVL
jgi:hypothetical protein